jgi:hypothetical protein
MCEYTLKRREYPSHVFRATPLLRKASDMYWSYVCKKCSDSIPDLLEECVNKSLYVFEDHKRLQ